MWALATILALVVAISGHAMLSRADRVPGNMVLKFLAPGLAAGAGLIVWLLSTDLGEPIEAIAALLAYACCCELYLFLFTMVSSSVTCSLLMRLSHGEVMASDLDALYREEDMVSLRMQKLVNNQLLSRSSVGYVLTARGETLLSVFERLRTVFRHSPEPDVRVRGERPTRQHMHLQ